MKVGDVLPEHLTIPVPATGEGGANDAVPPEPDELLESGRDIGRYRIVALLGSGGMGRVYCAHDRLLDRMVALKVLKGQAASAEQLRREAQALGRLSHPNVVSVYEVGVAQERTYIAMEHVPGVTLSDWLEQQQRTLREIVDVFVAAGRGLAAAHASGLVHRDFKPGNVLVDDSGRARVLDFGLASSLRGTRSRVHDDLRHAQSMNHTDSMSLGSSELALTWTGVIVGTPRYMAPEQHRGGEVGAEADQFAFCVALYEAVYGERPFGGESQQERRDAVLGGQLRRPAAKQPRRLYEVLKRGLSTNPQDRYPRLESLLAELESVARPRRWQPVVLLAIASCAALLVFLRTEDAPEPCPAGAELEEIWRSGARSQIEQAFAATGSFGEGRWDRIRGDLDDYVARWHATYGQVCRALPEKGASAKNDASMRCLLDARQRFEAVTRVLAEADIATVLRADDLTDELGEPGACASAVSERGIIAMQSNPEWDAEVAYVEALLVAGQHRVAEPIAHRLLETADDDRRAWALLVLASVQLETVSPEQAREALERAAWVARGRGDDRSFARASVLLTLYMAQTLKRYDAARTWSRHALASLQLQDDRELQARLSNAIGVIEHGLGNYEEALRQHERALSLLEDSPDSALYASTQNDIGNVLVYQARHDEAVKAYEVSHETWRRALGDDHPDVAVPLGGLARLYCELGECERSVPLLEGIIARWTEAYGPLHPKVGGALFNLGVVETRLGQAPRAQAHFEQALAVRLAAFGPEHPETAKSQAGLALAARLAGDWETCLTHAQRAVTLFELAHGRDSITLAGPLGSLSRCALALGDPATAARHARRDVEIVEKALGPDDLDLFDALGPLAEAQRMMGQLDDAIATYRRAVAIVNAREPHGTIAAEMRFGLARVLAEREGRTPEAIELAELARSTFERTPSRIGRLHEVQAWLADATQRRRVVLTPPTPGKPE